jgi:hypothetical protein
MNFNIKGALPPNILRENIRLIEGAALDGASIDDLSKLIGPITPGYLTSTPGYLTSTRILSGPFFRGRKSQSLPRFKSVKDLWYPPALAVGRGRANECGKPVFYCSATHEVVTRELGLAAGDRIVILKCTLLNPDRRPHVMEIGNLKKIIRTGRNISNERAKGAFDFRRLPAEVKNRALLIDAFFARVFGATEESYFNLTNAIARFYLASPEIDGLTYPSVKASGGYNLALKADAADRLLTPEFISSSYLVKELAGNRLFMRRDYLADIRPDKTLSWFRSVAIK